MLIQTPHLHGVFGDQSIFPEAGPDYRINFSDLHKEDTAARQALREFPLDYPILRKNDDTIVHLVVIGFGELGQSLALHAARIGHFANEAEKGIKLRITIVGEAIAQQWPEFLKRVHNFDKVCDAEPAKTSLQDQVFMDEMIKLASPAGVLLTYAFCLENDERNLRFGWELASKTGSRAQVLIHQTSRCGFAAVFRKEDRGESLAKCRIHAFGMREDIFVWDVLLRESEDVIASALHDHYQSTVGGESAHPGWADLPEAYKESNRRAADHIPIKLRALGCHIASLQPGKERVQHFPEDERLLLAQMEHVRWCAEKWLDDWQPGPETKREQKINHCLKPWAQLEPRDQTKDFRQIEAIPEILYRRGYGIYRV